MGYSLERLTNGSIFRLYFTLLVKYKIQPLRLFKSIILLLPYSPLPSLATRGIESKGAQDTYIRALKAKGVVVSLGKHRLEHGTARRHIDKHTPASRQDKVDIWDLEEKQTDVSLAIGMYRLLAKQQHTPAEERIEQIILVSADTDMTPSLKAIREDFPDIQVGIVLPHREGIDRGVPGSLKNFANWVRKYIKINEL